MTRASQKNAEAGRARVGEIMGRLSDGSITLNQAREKIGLPPIENGDPHFAEITTRLDRIEGQISRRIPAWVLAGMTGAMLGYIFGEFIARAIWP